ncbi:hypothetical protein [Maridesulfovibrio ferrireducens]|uniref:Uncharacterized protein n=1 Tax=Maridesulfovibrio ferrireducens TaxID=246191 RepID=A0A1G9I526_9BACT|nr:hypothetical protein [Maridesulfovibrio ferrireducens]MBI9111420.1 hypothetical protein [Maridesulfovibrio ferrireducens]SDL20347.1 hypothetical protein SAMN05660337_2452 [Maridesulfovibrio ferrireducens]
MAQFSPTDNVTLEDQIKSLANDELLDFWEETQFLAKMLNQENQEDVPYSPEYERLILQELQLRSCMKSLSP